MFLPTCALWKFARRRRRDRGVRRRASCTIRVDRRRRAAAGPGPSAEGRTRPIRPRRGGRRAARAPPRGSGSRATSHERIRRSGPAVGRPGGASGDPFSPAEAARAPPGPVAVRPPRRGRATASRRPGRTAPRSPSASARPPPQPARFLNFSGARDRIRTLSRTTSPRGGRGRSRGWPPHDGAESRALLHRRRNRRGGRGASGCRVAAMNGRCDPTAACTRRGASCEGRGPAGRAGRGLRKTTWREMRRCESKPPR